MAKNAGEPKILLGILCVISHNSNLTKFFEVYEPHRFQKVCDDLKFCQFQSSVKHQHVSVLWPNSRTGFDGTTTLLDIYAMKKSFGTETLLFLICLKETSDLKRKKETLRGKFFFLPSHHIVKSIFSTTGPLAIYSWSLWPLFREG